MRRWLRNLRSRLAPQLAAEGQGDLVVLLAQGVEAMRLTREYVGVDTLPAVSGWSWFDWCESAKAAISQHSGPGNTPVTITPI